MTLLCAFVSSLSLDLDLVTDDGLGVVDEAIEDGGCQAAVVIEDLRAVLEGAIGGDHHQGALVALMV